MKLLLYFAAAILSITCYAEVLTSTVDANVEYIPKINQIVNKGDILAKFDTRTVNIKIQEANLDLELAKEDYKDKKTDVDRYNKLKQVISVAEREDINVSYHTCRITVAKLKLKIKELEIKKSYHIIKAPFACKVTKSIVMINSGVEVGDKILQIQSI